MLKVQRTRFGSSEYFPTPEYPITKNSRPRDAISVWGRSAPKLISNGDGARAEGSMHFAFTGHTDELMNSNIILFGVYDDFHSSIPEVRR